MSRIDGFKTICWVIMKISLQQICLVLVFAGVSLAHDRLHAQELLETKITMQIGHTTLRNALISLEKEANVRFIYNPREIRATSKVSLNASGSKLSDILAQLFTPLYIHYEIRGKQIMLFRTRPGLRSGVSENLRMPGIPEFAPGKAFHTLAADTTVSVSGRIFEVNDPPIPLPGATIKVSGRSSVGTMSDEKGNFTLPNVPVNSTVTISMVGFKSQDFIVRGERSNLIFSLEEDLTALDEVVVTGFGTQKRREIASSVSTVNLGNLENKPVTQLSQALQGGTTGIVVQQQSGVVGNDQSNIRIRGIATLNNADPLVLIDGIPGNMNNLDPTTVETISVLKDAASASMYGSRGANGVILITTKRGKAGIVNVEYNGYYGLQQPLNKPKFVDGVTYMKMRNQLDINEGKLPGFSEEAMAATASQSDPARYPDTKWWDLTVRKSTPIQQHSVLVSGGNTASRFVVNLNHTRQLGQLQDLGSRPQSMYTRTTVRMNTTVDLTRNLFVYTDVFASRSDQTEPYVGGSTRNTGYLYGKIYAIPPTIVGVYPQRPASELPNYIPAGYRFYGSFGELWNPVAILEQAGTMSRANDQATINIRPQWKISNELTLNAQASYNVTSGLDMHDQLDYTFFNYNTFVSEGSNSFVKTAALDRRSNYFYWGGNFDYKKSIGLHNINAILGYVQELETRNNWDNIALRSYFGKVIYSFGERYLLEAGVRRDGSSIFGPGHKWGNFPSVAVGWNIDQEPFFRVRAIEGWKVRASYGILGNNRIAPYQYQNLINSNGTPSVFGNAALQWEKTAIFNIGTDVSLASGFDITAEWYDKTTTDILIRSEQFYSSGIGISSANGGNTAPLFNAGSARVRGIDLSLKYTRAINNNFRVHGSVGYSKMNSRILSLITPGVPIIQGNSILMEGGALSERFGFKTLGLLQQADVENPDVTKFSGQKAGEIRFADTNNDGVLNDNDRIPLGNTEPTDIFFAGLGFKYRGLDFDALTSGSAGRDFFYEGVLANPFQGNIGTQATPQIYQTDTWTPQNTGAALPVLSAAGIRFSDFYRKNADFLRVRYIQLGYTLPVSFTTGKLRTKSLRLYFNAQNPFTFTRLKMVDPEVLNTSGVSIQETVAPNRVLSMGVNLKF